MSRADDLSARIEATGRSNLQLDEEIASPALHRTQCGVSVATSPHNDLSGNWSDYETMMREKFSKTLTLPGIKYRMLKQ